MPDRPSRKGPKGPERPKPPRKKPQPRPAEDPEQASASEGAAASKVLARYRQQISELDAELVGLLNERAGLVVEVGKTQARVGRADLRAAPRGGGARAGAGGQRGAAARPDDRGGVPGADERELRARAAAADRVSRASRVVLAPGERQATSARAWSTRTCVEISGVFTEVRRGHVNYGLVPIENSLGGGIVETLDAFKGARGQGVRSTPRCRWRCTTRSWRIVSPAGASGVLQAGGDRQCRTWLATQYPQRGSAAGGEFQPRGADGG
jgi:chorismate mutase / prephenate dehydratase